MGKHDVQYAMIEKEFNKLSMCKRGTLHTERNTMIRTHREEHGYGQKPTMTLDEREAVFKLHRKRLLKVLKFKCSRDLSKTAGSYYSESKATAKVFTEKSLREYDHEIAVIFKHPDEDEWKATVKKFDEQDKLISEQYRIREAMMDADFKQATMDLISGTVPITDFMEVYNNLDAKEF